MPHFPDAPTVTSRPAFARNTLGTILSACCELAIIVVVVLQTLTLYTTPVADSNRWGGDETWLMREFGHQISSGVMQYPESFGEAPRTDGVLAGSMWVEALIYGGTGTLLFPSFDLVDIGRSVTWVLSLVLVASVLWILRKLGVPRLLSAVLVLGMVASPGFLFASHSARYDILTGLTLLWYFYLLCMSRSVSLTGFWLGVIAVSVIIFSRHLLTLTVFVSLWYVLVELRKDQEQLLKYALGAAGAAVMLVLAYAFSAHEFSLFGRGGGMGSYSFVLTQIPIARPFSRSVQFSNLLERLQLFWHDSPMVLLALGLSILTLLVNAATSAASLSGKKALPEYATRWLIYTGISAFSWILFQGARPYYLFHIVPVCVVATGIALGRERLRVGLSVAMLLTGIVLVASTSRISPSLGAEARVDSKQATRQLLALTPKGHTTRILCDVAILHSALKDTSRDVLTLDMFQPPASREALVQKLRSNRITHVILRSAIAGTAFEPGRVLLPNVLDSAGAILSRVTGYFYDDAWDYYHNTQLTQRAKDTLTLYQVR